MPRELGVFYWVIDAKAPDQITAWETWWSTTVLQMLQWRSLTNPAAATSYSCWITRRGCTLAWQPNQASPSPIKVDGRTASSLDRRSKSDTDISRNMLAKLYYDRARRVDLGDLN